ncbi:MAG TPA: tRNA lysidine(34) synthetase TilS [Gemmatimonadaceae bacterium]
MARRHAEEDEVISAVSAALGGLDRVLLAVSGGLDSMVLLHASSSLPKSGRPRLRVANFDHRTGDAARRATLRVGRAARSAGLDFVTAAANTRQSTEHEWRKERWRFLRSAATAFKAPVATAHTLDDQVETVFIRALRDSGPRGLAGLYAESEILHPFLGLTRSTLARYADTHGISYIDDPSNLSRTHLRNRVRHDLLPAIARVRPTFAAELLDVARGAAGWRVAIDQIAEGVRVVHQDDGSLRIARSDLAGYSADSLRVLWPAIAARAGVIMDRRGTQRLAQFTIDGATGGAIQLSGGVEVRMYRGYMLIRKWDWRRVEEIRSTRAAQRGASSFSIRHA